jgi:hypothetical protein
MRKAPLLLGSSGRQRGLVATYEPGSVCKRPMKTSATMRPPTGPSWSPSATTSASYRT